MFEINSNAWNAIRNYEEKKEYDEELELLKSKTRSQRIREMNAKLKGLNCQICGTEIFTEIWSTTQAAPKFCHKLSCKSEGKRRTNRKSKDSV
jgi:hypothetical protein